MHKRKETKQAKLGPSDHAPKTNSRLPVCRLGLGGRTRAHMHERTSATADRTNKRAARCNDNCNKDPRLAATTVLTTGRPPTVNNPPCSARHMAKTSVLTCSLSRKSSLNMETFPPRLMYAHLTCRILARSTCNNPQICPNPPNSMPTCQTKDRKCRSWS